ncbi:MAG: hypothetical protein LBQ20_13200 [Rhodanobacter sp.]|nr:hypothetical protein [Rhodanobacter sp.]
MNKLVFAAAICTVGLGACSQLREPTDQQLTSLLRVDAVTAGGSALLDSEAIDCLRALSGDKDLLKGLSAHIAGETGMKSCRTRLEGMVAEATRNPAKLRLADFSAPKIVRRAMALQVSRMNARVEQPPAPVAAIPPPDAAPDPIPVSAPTAPVSNVDMGSSSATLKNAEDLCGQAKEAAAQADATSDLKNFAASCAANIGMIRTYMQRAANNNDSERLGNLTSSVENIIKAGHEAMGQ